MRGSSFGRFSLPIHVNSSFCFFVIPRPIQLHSLAVRASRFRSALERSALVTHTQRAFYEWLQLTRNNDYRICIGVRVVMKLPCVVIDLVQFIDKVLSVA